MSGSYSNTSGIGEVSVFNPRTVVDPRVSLAPHVTYSVRDANYGPEVERRYSDFLWFSNRLEYFYPGVIIPPLPAKNSLARFNDRFIEARRVALEKFINKVVRHHRLGKFSDLETFLHASEAVFSAAKRESADTMPSAVAAWIDKAPLRKAKPVRTPVDEKFDALTATVDALHAHASNMSRAVADFINNSYQQGAAMRAMSEVLFSVEGLEEDPTLCAYTAEFKRELKSNSDAYEGHGNDSAFDVMYPIEEYVMLLESVQKALRRRARLSGRLDCARELVALANGRLLSNRSDMGSEYVRRLELQQALEEDRELTAQLAHMSEELLREYRQFQDTRVREMNLIFVNFANLQLSFARAMDASARLFEGSMSSLAPKVHEPCFTSLPTSKASARTSVPSKPPPSAAVKPAVVQEETYSFRNVQPAIMQEIEDDS